MTDRAYTQIIFGNPGNKRTIGWQQALAYHHHPAALEISYARLLHAIRAGETLLEVIHSMSKRQQYKHKPNDSLSEIAVDPAGIDQDQPGFFNQQPSSAQLLHNQGKDNSWLTLRLDAPGENFAVEKGLIALGAPDAADWQDDSLLPMSAHTHGAQISATSARALQPQSGRILYPAQWFRGYCRLLSWLEAQVTRYVSQARWMNAPADIAIMFDKRYCSFYLQHAGIAVPPVLQSQHGQPLYSQPSGRLSDEYNEDYSGITGYSQLRAVMEKRNIHRVFVKLFCGSGASGVIAYQIQPSTGAEIAMTTIGMEEVNGEWIFYNSGKLIRYTDLTSIQRMMDWMGSEGMHVERWISKDTMNHQAFDIRQLVCRDYAGHAVIRLSRTPITNLHLRNKRMLLEESDWSADRKQAVATAALTALHAFPESFCAGIDVLVPAGGGAPLIMDMNPFGDLLYHVKHDGMNTYEWELAHWLDPSHRSNKQPVRQERKET